MKILIVDDNPDILEGLEVSINWLEIGMETPLTAENAAQAKRILEGEDVDILMTDIEMPGESGLELWADVHTLYPQLMCLFLTSHAEFDYAQKAIREGGFDYILQPARPIDIEGAIIRCRNRVLENRKVVRMQEKGYDELSQKIIRQMAETLFREGRRFGGRISEWNAETNPDNSVTAYIPVIIQFFGTAQEWREEQIHEMMLELFNGEKINSQFVCSRIDKQKYGLILFCREQIDYGGVFTNIHRNISGRWGQENAVYVGIPAKDGLEIVIDRLKTMCSDNVYQKKEVFYMEERSVKTVTEKPDLNRWTGWIVSGDGVLVRNQIRNLIRWADEGGELTLEYMNELFRSYSEALSIACHRAGMYFSDLFDDFFKEEQFQTSYLTVKDFINAVDISLKRLEKKKNHDDRTRSMTVEERVELITKYIDSHISEPLPRYEMAKMVFLNEDYLSRVFKNIVGMGYKEYVIKSKMEYSKTLLKQTNFPVSIIASKAGYDNFSNFSQAFRKYTGQAPQDYRKA